MPFRGRGFEIRRNAFAGVAAIVVVLAAWQLGTTIGIINQTFLPSPLNVFDALADLTLSGELLRHLQASLVRIFSGWLLGTMAGLVVGFSMGLFSLARNVGMPLVSCFYPIPKIALLPLFILWLGIGETSKIGTIALGVFFPTVISAFGGVDGAPRNLIKMAQSFNVPFLSIVFKVVLPSSLPSILSGLRISFSTALLLVVAAEMIGADRGIGAFVLTAGNLMQTDQLLAGVITISLLGLATGTLVSALERLLLRWR
ncbi:MAG: ABC transporter permease [Rhizobiales bacterium 62-17]|nr:MAG: ABC transporter permease [Rhizobiales bacterium 62-17]